MQQNVAAILLILFTSTFIVDGSAAPHTLTSSAVIHGFADTAKPVFPDEFSDLDEASATVAAAPFSAEIEGELEKARQQYLKALASIERKDTSRAALEFEAAISILNELSSTPRIEENIEFTDLVQSVIEDYESHVRNIDDLDENSSIFILRDRLFMAVDSTPIVGRITVPKPPKPDTVLPTVIPLTYNEYVEKNIQFLAYDKGRKFMKKWLERGSRWFPTLKRIAEEEGMPPEIVYLAMFESGLNPTAVSRAKAVGMWQFIKSTGDLYDLDVSTWIDERRDVEKATRSSMRFLKDLYNEFGDWHLALASYNCGPGGVRRAMRRAGLENGSFWDIQDKLPRETRNYVPGFIATTLISMNREQYGFPDDSLQMLDPYEYEVFTVNEPISLEALARCANISYDSLRALNPELLRTCTPPGMKYDVKIPVNTKELFITKFALLTDDEKRPWITHTVARRETVASIARTYGISPTELAGINNIRGYKSRLRRGITLRIPVRSALSTASADAALASTAAVQPAVQLDEGTAKQIHVVKSGDNLTSIAQRYGVRMADIRNWNNIAYNRETIHVGDSIVVSVKDQNTSVTDVERIPVSRIVLHRVVRGETLASIATRYTTTVERLQELNNLKNGTVLKSGKTLKVETSLSKNEVAVIERVESGTPVTHIVRRGESLGSIAALYGVRESDLVKWNLGEIDGTTVFAGSRLQIHSQKTIQGGGAPPPTSKKLPKTYRVRSGDTLSGIADKFGLDISVLRVRNPSLKDDIIRTGQRIRLQ
ncbi:MAG: LysM peptidoglycan-binding domain-containing protein [Ignavibacteria bacterium]|nr:LysM peptidoglycan-binding domain-containing protein [Ignavibacteria bacterium]